MKRFLSLLLAVAMIVSTLIIVSLPASAVEGDWMVYARKEQYRDDYEDDEYVSVMGYEYTNEGFHTISPEFYAGQSPRGGLQTKSTYDLKEGVYMLIRVDEFSYDAPDKWLNLNLWSEPMVELASSDAERDGYGVQTIMRPGNDGKFIQLEWYIEGFTQVQVSSAFQGVDMYDEEGRALFELVVTYENNSFALTINGIAAPQKVIDYMNETFVDMEAHLGMAFFHTKTLGDASFTVLKYGTTKETALTPSGDDKEAPVNYSLEVAEIADPSTVEDGKPAILINGSKDASDSYTTAGKSSTGNSILNEDNSVTYIASSSSVSVVYKPKNEVSYSIDDFPAVMMLVRNLCTCGEEDGSCIACEEVTMYLVTGEFNSPDGDHCTPLYVCWEPIEIDGDSYLYFYTDMSDDFAPWDAEGRVNAVRMDFNGIDYATPGLNQFDVCFVGFFRDMEDAEGYVYDYLGVEKPAETESTTEEATTEAPGETTDATTETTKAPEKTTGADSDDNTANDDENSGCGSVVGFGAVAMVTTIGAVAFVTFKKKKED
ncbi:MAG: hypothetical protein IJD74_05595 [Clostridia bacterium]|nr:hypothetical protein [Clostridia bacterium]